MIEAIPTWMSDSNPVYGILVALVIVIVRLYWRDKRFDIKTPPKKEDIFKWLKRKGKDSK